MKGKTAALLLAAAFLASCRSLWLYFPDRTLHRTPADLGLEYSELRIGREETSINAWWIPRGGGRYTVLFCHGNAGNISTHVGKAKLLHECGFSVLIFDYRGYGTSEGSVSEENMYGDARAAWKELTEKRGVSPDRIIVWGNSLGGPVAAKLASETKPAGLVLESTFFSLERMAAERSSCLGGIFVSADSFNTARSLESVRCPVLVIHSRTDEVIPLPHGNSLYKDTPGKKMFVEINGSHNRGLFESRALVEPGLARYTKLLPKP
jgi:uncharacterized protein